MITEEGDYGVTLRTLDADYQSSEPHTIWSIKFYPSAISDIAVFKLTDDTGQIFTRLMNVSTLDPVIEYFPPYFRANICFDLSASSINTAANARLIIIYRRGY